MSRLCNHCECLTINGVRCHERGCKHDGEALEMIPNDTDENTTTFVCRKCEQILEYVYTFPFNPLPALGNREPEVDRDNFDRWALREAQDMHTCDNKEYWDDFID